MSEDRNKKLIQHILTKTMQKEITWSCLDVLELEDIILGIKNEVHGLEIASVEASTQLEILIEQMAWKGHKADKILKVAQTKQNKIDLIKRRLKFAKKNLKRMTRRLRRFPVTNATGWYFAHEKTYYSENFKIILIRTEGTYQLVEKGSRGTTYIDISSDEYPKLFTLGIILKRGNSVELKSETIHSLGIK